MKKELMQNARDMIKKDIDIKNRKISESVDKFFIEVNKLFVLSHTYKNDITLETIIEERAKISKTNYAFPDILNIGQVLAVTEQYSGIFNKSLEYHSKFPFIVPIKNNSISFLINHKYKEQINQEIETIGLKLINSIPRGLSRVILIDKAGSGQNFKMLGTLHDKFLDGKILSTDHQIEEEILELKNTMSSITKAISNNGFKSIEDYNLNTDEVPQPYTFVFIDSFPNGFSKTATENLVSLLENGSKAGIYIFQSIIYDPLLGMNQNIGGTQLSQLIKNTVTFSFVDRNHELINKKLINENIEVISFPIKDEAAIKQTLNSKYKIIFDYYKDNQMKLLIENLNKEIENFNIKPLIPLEKVYPKELWTKSANKGYCVPFGKRGIENTYISLGINQYGEDEATHHGLIGGATGSGKTVLIHDIILMGALNYSPDEIEFFLLDYKEGTEFAVYKDFEYIKILSMDSEIEFGQEVLMHAVSTIKERGRLFKEVGAANLNEYNKKAEKPLKRIIIIIDEFQALLPKDQRVTSKTNDLLDQILRLGRSFGINLLLATQTLKGIDIEPAILSNLPLRIALKMDGKDATKIFNENNSAPRFLSNPGEGIYNKSYGNSKNNEHFQALLALGDTIDNTIQMVKGKIKEERSEDEIKQMNHERFVYEGDKTPEMSNNIINNINSNKKVNCAILGMPSGLSKDEVFVEFKNEYGENLLCVGSEADKATSIFINIAMQYAQHSLSFFNFNTVLSQRMVEIQKEYKKEFPMYSNIEAENQLEVIYKDFLERKEKLATGHTKYDKKFLFFFYIESSKLFENRSKTRQYIEELLQDGPEVGIHILIYAVDYVSLTNFDLIRELNKFNKKIILKGGNSLKVLGTENTLSFSKLKTNAIISLNGNAKKFKPYAYKIGEKNDKKR